MRRLGLLGGGRRRCGRDLPVPVICHSGDLIVKVLPVGPHVEGLPGPSRVFGFLVFPYDGSGGVGSLLPLDAAALAVEQPCLEGSLILPVRHAGLQQPCSPSGLLQHQHASILSFKVYIRIRFSVNIVAELHGQQHILSLLQGIAPAALVDSPAHVLQPSFPAYHMDALAHIFRDLQVLVQGGHGLQHGGLLLGGELARLVPQPDLRLRLRFRRRCGLRGLVHQPAHIHRLHRAAHALAGRSACLSAVPASRQQSQRQDTGSYSVSPLSAHNILPIFICTLLSAQAAAHSSSAAAGLCSASASPTSFSRNT